MDLIGEMLGRRRENGGGGGCGGGVGRVGGGEIGCYAWLVLALRRGCHGDSLMMVVVKCDDVREGCSDLMNDGDDGWSFAWSVRDTR